MKLPLTHTPQCGGRSHCVPHCPAYLNLALRAVDSIIAMGISPGSEMIEALQIDTGIPQFVLLLMFTERGSICSDITIDAIRDYEAWEGRKPLEFLLKGGDREPQSKPARAA